MNEKGFTLIELVVVIVILGILAATALPKFIDLKSDAEAAAMKGVAGAVNSAFAINAGAYPVNSTKAARVSGVITLTTGAFGSAIMNGGMPAGFTMTAAASTVACGTTAQLAIPITVSNSAHSTAASQTAAATLICTG